jgi:hypothetical protein
MGVERTDWDAEFFMVLSIGWIVSMHIHNIRPVVDRLGHQPDMHALRPIFIVFHAAMNLANRGAKVA